MRLIRHKSFLFVGFAALLAVASEVTKVVVSAAKQQLAVAVDEGQLAADTAAQYQAQLALFAPLLVNSPEATALALQATAS